jgi:predicted TIM-barrel fold metal-dependent hydrolase
MIQKAAHNGDIDSKVRSTFEKKALEILSKGAVGFGELTAEHFSLAPNHPYESAPPDHPLFLLLSDIAADHDVPIDLHMEAVCEKMQTPVELRLPPNPDIFYPNINSFERLLDHNLKAKIIWAHAGWDNTGYRTATLCRELLEKHPNLYMSIKFGHRGRPENRIIYQQNRIEPEWLHVISAFSERFLIGSDQFYFPPGARERTYYNVEVAVMLLSLLPLELSRKVGHENASRIFGLVNKTE